MELVFTGPLFEWRGPAPYHFVEVPEDEAEQLRETAAAVTYGWGMIPVRGRIGDDRVHDLLWPQEVVTSAGQGRRPQARGAGAR